MSPLGIPIESINCPRTVGPILRANWINLLWAAITAGRPNRYYMFRHGQSSLYEAIFRDFVSFPETVRRIAFPTAVRGDRIRIKCGDTWPPPNQATED